MDYKLRLKKLKISDVNLEYLSWMNDYEVTKFTEQKFKKHSLLDIKNFVKEKQISKKEFLYGIFIKENSHLTHIGNIKIDPVNKRHGLGEYGIMMGDSDEWGKGYAKEASEIVIDHCFRELRLRKITLGVVEDNSAALNLYKKLGFSTEGVYRDHGYYDGKLCNLIRMAIFNPTDAR